jgi:hypothetical protein
MMGSLETSITLEDVFAVVHAKRVPLAPELAGYLALELAEGVDPHGGDVELRSVFIGEEGTVAVVKPKRASVVGDAEQSIRDILARLLDASGAATPALGATARRKAGDGIRTLVEELEAALIPVNRAAGRRALARLAREVRRVTLGVGRNAMGPASERAPRSSVPSYASVRTEAEGLREPPASRRSAPEPPALAASTAPPPVVAAAPTAPAARDVPVDAAIRAAVDATVDARANATGDATANATTTAMGDEVDALLATFDVGDQSEQARARELKQLVGLDPTPPPPTTGDSAARPKGPVTRELDADIEALLAASGPEDTVRPSREAAGRVERDEAPAEARVARRAVAERPRAATTSVVDRGTPPSAARPASLPSVDLGSVPPKRSDRVLALLAVLALAAGAIALWFLRPSLFGRGGPSDDEGPATPETSSETLPSPRASACRATLTVTDVPPHAEVLLRVGNAPIDIERMPVGTRLEFVALSEGYGAKRTVVPAGASWEHGRDGKPRYELAVQLDPVKSRSKAGELWPAAEPGSEVGGKGPPGTVHIVSTPKGAEIWLLAGLGPEAVIEQLSCNADVDVLVAGPTTFRKRLHVDAASFASAASSAPSGGTTAAGAGELRVAKVSAKGPS